MLNEKDTRTVERLQEYDPIAIKKLEHFVFECKLQHKIVDIIEAWYLKVLQVNFYDTIVDFKTAKEVKEIGEVFGDILDTHDDMEVHEDLNKDTSIIKIKKTQKKKIILPKLPKFEPFAKTEEKVALLE